LPTRGLDISRTGQVADWTTRGFADAAKSTKTKHAKSRVASASCPLSHYRARVWSVTVRVIAWFSRITSVLGRRAFAVLARSAADGWPLMWVNHLLQASQPGQLSLSSFRGR